LDLLAVLAALVVGAGVEVAVLVALVVDVFVDGGTAKVWRMEVDVDQVPLAL
jgi:hypothetical protein